MQWHIQHSIIPLLKGTDSGAYCCSAVCFVQHTHANISVLLYSQFAKCTWSSDIDCIHDASSMLRVLGIQCRPQSLLVCFPWTHWSLLVEQWSYILCRVGRETQNIPGTPGISTVKQQGPSQREKSQGLLPNVQAGDPVMKVLPNYILQSSNTNTAPSLQAPDFVPAGQILRL